MNITMFKTLTVAVPLVLPEDLESSMSGSTETILRERVSTGKTTMSEIHTRGYNRENHVDESSDSAKCYSSEPVYS
jgi:hypothetical protein